MNALGQGTQKDPSMASARSLYHRACDAGEEDACRAFERLSASH
jgi:TPR repeat protein